MKVIFRKSASAVDAALTNRITYLVLGGIHFLAKASFSAYVLGNNLLKAGEKVYFSTKKSTTNFGRPFCSFPFPFLASKWQKYAVFAFQKPRRQAENEASANFLQNAQSNYISDRRANYLSNNCGADSKPSSDFK